MGLLSPIGHGPDAFWDALMTGRSGAHSVRSFDTSNLPRRIACEIDSLPPASAEFDGGRFGAGRCGTMALLAVQAALIDAGLSISDMRGRRVAVVVGTTMGEFEFIESAYDDLAGQPASPEIFDKAVNNPAGRLSQIVAEAIGRPDATALDAYGACAAGNMALITAMQMLRADECDLVLAGGADAFSRFAFVGFMRNRVMAKEACRPYDKERDGLLVAEGAAMFVVERARDASGQSRHARLLGGATSCDAFNPTQPRPDGNGIAAAVQCAARDAGVSERRVDYLCSHGTGTPRNDLTEWKAIDRMFAPETPFSSIKALTGHTMGAAGALEAAACILALKHQRLVPNWNMKNPAASFATRPVERPDAADLACVANLSFGFGGYNSCLFLDRGDS